MKKTVIAAVIIIVLLVITAVVHHKFSKKNNKTTPHVTVTRGAIEEKAQAIGYIKPCPSGKHV